MLVCNVHDISWGTKGDNVAKDLGGVVTTKGVDGGMEADVDFPVDKSDINYNYQKFVDSINSVQKVKESGPSKVQLQDDYFRNFRTKTLLVWVFSNALIVTVMTNELLLKSFYKSINFVPGNDFNPYLKVILYNCSFCFIRVLV